MVHRRRWVESTFVYRGLSLKLFPVSPVMTRTKSIEYRCSRSKEVTDRLSHESYILSVSVQQVKQYHNTTMSAPIVLLSIQSVKLLHIPAPGQEPITLASGELSLTELPATGSGALKALALSGEPRHHHRLAGSRKLVADM